MASNTDSNSMFEVVKRDFLYSFDRVELAFTLAVTDIRARYARSILGPFWVSLSTIAIVGAMSFLVTGLFGGDIRKVAPFIFISIITYSFIQQTLQESTVAFIGNRHHLLGSPMPYFVFIMTLVLRNFIILLHQLPVLLIAFILFGVNFSWINLLSLVGLAIVTLTISGLSIIIATLSARYRDVIPLVTMILGIGALLSPVYWRVTTLVKNKFIAQFNPITYLLEIVRGPFTGFETTHNPWIVSIIICVISWVIGLIIFTINRKRLPFWI